MSQSTSTETPVSGNHTDRRVTSHRERVGNKVLERETNKILEELQPHLAERYFELARLHESGTQTLVPLPMTTRGIGFNTQLFYNKCQSFASTQERPLNQRSSPLPLYRISLLQAEIQLAAAHQGRNLGIQRDSDVYVPSVFRPSLHRDVLTRNSVLTATSVRSFGTVTWNDAIYIPFVPKCTTERVHCTAPVAGPSTVDDCMSDASSVVLPAKRNKRRTPVRREAPPPPPPVEERLMFKPDPFLVTFSNLRRTVVALADPETPLEWREHFYRYNPIPGSRWQDFLLMNPNDIMPHGYGQNNLSRDNDLARFLFGVAQRKDQSYVCSVPLDGLGATHSLCTMSMQGSRPYNVDMMDPELEDVNFCSHVLRMNVPLPAASIMSSCLGLVTELPERRIGEQWSYRTPWLSMKNITYSWFTLVNQIMNSEY